MKFIKMHGAGNDYVYVDCFNQPTPDAAALAPAVSDRHKGIGADGIILVLPPDDGVDAHARMRMFNADGSESEMCGNGVRCVCKMVHDHQLVADVPNPMKVQTGAGVLSLAYELDDQGKVAQVTVDMGEPILEPDDVPVSPDRMVPTGQAQTFMLDSVNLKSTFVSMGNPHAVIYVDAIDPDHHLQLGQRLEYHEAFPNRMNLHFVQQQSEDEVSVLHWERGSGPTLACGTGACAVGVAGVLTGKTSRTITTHLPGGDLTIEWRESDNHVYMTGPAVEVFAGVWPS